jgi:hypothetical protein
MDTKSAKNQTVWVRESVGKKQPNRAKKTAQPLAKLTKKQSEVP